MNPDRNEGTLKLGEKEYRIKATATALRKIDELCGTLMKFLTKLEEGDFRFAEVQGIVHALAVGGMGPGAAPEPDDLGDEIVEHGIVPTLEAISPLIARALTGGSKYQAPKKKSAKK